MHKILLPLILGAVAGAALAKELPKGAITLPEDLQATLYSDHELTPCPAALAVSPQGAVYVGVDLNGSLGKGPGKGRIVKLHDDNHDGVADRHTIYADIDNVRGLIPMGHKLIVLHTVIPKSTGILSGMHLSELIDANNDGVADGPAKILVRDISVAKHNQNRGADHTTNGIRLGIDGWIYIAVGDFGMVNATGSDGTVLTKLGGCVLRVRPDGSEMEIYTHGLRNIYDVAVDPFLNVFTRGNTNDGGGWNIRFIHHVQSGRYGYPMLFKHFTEEILPALADLGGGSGTGALFLDEPSWPAAYNKTPMMCDWGRSQLVIHRVTPDGASFTQDAEEFIKLSQITDADVDGSGRMFLGAWDGAGFKGNPDKGYLVQVTPKDWTYRPYPDLEKADASTILRHLASESAVARTEAQRVILAGAKVDMAAIKALALEPEAVLEARIAALFTVKQALGVEGSAFCLQAAKDPSIREWALRAAADRIPQNSGLDIQPFVEALEDSNPRIRATAAVALGRIGNQAAAPALLTQASALPANEDGDGPELPTYSGPLLKKSMTQSLDIDITGFKSLALMMLEGGDGSGSDHGAWFEPVLVRADGTEKKLTELTWTSASQGWGKTLVNKSCTGSELKTTKGKAFAFGIGSHTPSLITYKLDEPFVRLKTTVGVTASAGNGGGTIAFAVHDKEVKVISTGNEGPHATPNSALVVPHLAVQSLVQLNAHQACVDAIGSPNQSGALWALRYLHDGSSALVNAYKAASPETQAAILPSLVRLSKKEKPYDGSWWWSTRPDTHGPYYYHTDWEGSEAIKPLIRAAWDSGDKAAIALMLAKHRVDIEGIDISSAIASAPKKKEEKVDLSKVDTSAGEVGKMAIEDVILALDKVKPNLKLGKQLFDKQGCMACHTLTADEVLKGPYMGQIGNIMDRDAIALSILKPNASISQGFATFTITTKDKKGYTGFISAESATEVEMRDIAGNVHKIQSSNIDARHEMPISMMPPGLANALSMKEFASLVAFLSKQKQ